MNHQLPFTSTLTIPAFGIGTLPLGVVYNTRPTEQQARDILFAALDGGCRFIDTADVYCTNMSDKHYCERLVGDTVRQWQLQRSKNTRVIIATKGGMSRHGDGLSTNSWSPVRRFNAEKIRETVNASREALGVEMIDLWQVHHSDLHDADGDEWLEVIETLKQLVAEAKVEKVGLCNASVRHIQRALNRGLRVYSVQNEFSLWSQVSLESKTC